MNVSSGNSVVDAIGQVNITGNVIPMTWFQSVTRPNGKPDTLAIVLLSEFVYWYRPKEVRDENTGLVVGWRKKFHADKLQKSYTQLAEQFGYTKTQVRDACKRLEELGLITIEFRTLDVKGTKIANVMFVELVPARIKEITFTYAEQDTPQGHENSTHHAGNSEGAVEKNPDTNTETISETSSETISDNTPHNLTRKRVEGGGQRKRSLSPKNQAVNQLIEHFLSLTKIKYPASISYAARNKMWVTPLRNLADMNDWDMEASKELMRATVEEMRGKRLTVSTPYSIINTAASIYAERQVSPADTFDFASINEKANARLAELDVS